MLACSVVPRQSSQPQSTIQSILLKGRNKQMGKKSILHTDFVECGICSHGQPHFFMLLPDWFCPSIARMVKPALTLPPGNERLATVGLWALFPSFKFQPTVSCIHSILFHAFTRAVLSSLVLAEPHTPAASESPYINLLGRCLVTERSLPPANTGFLVAFLFFSCLAHVCLICRT